MVYTEYDIPKAYYSHRQSEKVVVPVYKVAHLCEDFSALSITNIIPYLMYLYCYFTGTAQNMLGIRFSSVSFQFIDQPAGESQDPRYDGMSANIFGYIITSIPRNHTLSFVGYSLNKSKGLQRAGEALGAMYDPAELNIPLSALSHARVFFDNNWKIYQECFKVLLSFASPDLSFAGYSYALELMKSVQFVYMQGIKMIEDYIIEGEPILRSIPLVANNLVGYYRFRKRQISEHGQYWKFSAVLDIHAWRKYKETEGFKTLWKIAAICASFEEKSYLSLTIDGMSVQQLRDQTKYSVIVSKFMKASEGLVIANDIIAEGQAKKASDLFASWSVDV